MINKIPSSTVIAIAGTVGVGKTTLTEKLSQKLNFKPVYENVDTNPYLNLFYEDMEKWAFHLQLFFLIERSKSIQEINNNGGGCVQDRTIFEDANIFAKMNFDKKRIIERDFNTYTHLFEVLSKTNIFPGCDIIIYLEGDLENILNRIQKRGREMEINTDTEYWIELKNRYDQWINAFSSVPVIKLNINDFNSLNEQHIDNLILQIKEKIS